MIFIMLYFTSRNPINVVGTLCGSWIRSLVDDQGFPLLSVSQKTQILVADLHVITVVFIGFVVTLCGL